MSLISVRSLWIPRLIGLGTAYFDNTTLVVDASGEKAAFILRAPATGTLKKVGFRTGAVTQNQTIRVSFQDVNTATGFPDGVVDQWRNLAIADTEDNTAKETGLVTSDGTDGGSLRSVTRGELLAVVFEHNPFNAGDIFRLSAINTGNDTGGTGYSALYTTSWAKVATPPALALTYDDGAGGDKCEHSADIFPGTQAYSYMGFNNGSANPKRGMKFRLPFAAKMQGALLRLKSNGNFDVKLYDSDGQTELLSQSIVAAATDYGYNRWHSIKFSGEASLAANTYYYVLVEPTTATNVDLMYMDVPTGKEFYWDQMDGGKDFHYAERASGAPTATTTRRPLFSLELTSIDDGTGSLRPGPWGMLR